MVCFLHGVPKKEDAKLSHNNNSVKSSPIFNIIHPLLEREGSLEQTAYKKFHNALRVLPHYFGKIESPNLPQFTEVNFTNSPMSYLTEYERFYVTDRPTDNVTRVARSVHPLHAHTHTHEDDPATRQLLYQSLSWQTYSKGKSRLE